MDEEDLRVALFARMRWNAPLSVEHAELLMDRLGLGPGLRIADIGSAWGELLLRVAERVRSSGGEVRAIGVDTDAWALARGREAARQRGLGEQVEFVEADAAGWRETADRVLCVGASHAFGGTGAALEALRGLVPAGGRLLFGDGYWAAEPSRQAVRLFGEGMLSLGGLLEAVRAREWRVIHMSVADQREWDDFESTFRAGRQEWLLAHPDDPRAGEVRDWLDSREREYVGTYRGVLGFAYLVLAH
jgi:cyclopropane fatty-acyl-phospholipid synthase-like methyltransferase